MKQKKIQLPIFSKEILKKKLDKKNEQILLEILYRHQKQINEEIKIKMEDKKPKKEKIIKGELTQWAINIL